MRPLDGKFVSLYRHVEFKQTQAFEFGENRVAVDVEEGIEFW